MNEILYEGSRDFVTCIRYQRKFLGRNQLSVRVRKRRFDEEATKAVDNLSERTERHIFLPR